MERLELNVGDKYLFDKKEVILIKVIDLQYACVEEVYENNIHTIPIAELSLIPTIEQKDRQLDILTDSEWDRAKSRFKALKPILENRGDFELVKKVAKEQNINPVTVYRWLKTYDSHKTVASLAGVKRKGGKGKSRLSIEQEKLLWEVIEKYYLNRQRKSINSLIRKIQEKFKEAEIEPPHPNTVRNRVKSIDSAELIKRRHGAKQARERFDAIDGHYLGKNYPLGTVQIDHTRLDIILVDEYYRKPLKRPFITVAIDVYSRMVVGYYIAYETPGFLGTGLCIANSILPKEELLAKFDIDAEWPCWGIMDTIHCDNAKEFKGKMLEESCFNYGINLEFRPIGKPNYGGHIERLLGTFAKEIHNLPGTTFSSIEEKGTYDSKSRAGLTISELEKWLLIYITKVYHHKTHSSLGMAPIQKYNDGILGSDTTKGIGFYPRITDNKRVQLDFMPFVKRNVQRNGIVIDHIRYYDEVLSKYILPSSYPDKKKIKLTFKRDPRDISIIYFLDPHLNEYFEIPYRDVSKPPMSIWEHRAILKELNNKNISVDESSIFKAYQEMESLELDAIKRTRKTRKSVKNKRPDIKENTQQKKEINSSVNLRTKEIKAFDDIDDGAFN